jgi:hypothetical protein
MTVQNRRSDPFGQITVVGVDDKVFHENSLLPTASPSRNDRRGNGILLLMRERNINCRFLEIDPETPAKCFRQIDQRLSVCPVPHPDMPEKRGLGFYLQGPENCLFGGESRSVIFVFEPFRAAISAFSGGKNPFKEGLGRTTGNPLERSESGHFNPISNFHGKNGSAAKDKEEQRGNRKKGDQIKIIEFPKIIKSSPKRSPHRTLLCFSGQYLVAEIQNFLFAEPEITPPDFIGPQFPLPDIILELFLIRFEETLYFFNA